MHRLPLAAAILLFAMLGPVSCVSIVSAAHAEQKSPGFSALIDLLNKDRDKSGPANDAAKDVMPLSEGAAPSESQPPPPPPTPERLAAAQLVANSLPAVGSGEGTAKIEHVEVNIDPPKDALYFARGKIVFTGDRPITVYYLNKPVAERGTPEDEAEKRITAASMTILDLPVGASARITSQGSYPLFFCMARPIIDSAEGACTLSVAGVPILLVGTYPRRNDKALPFDSDTFEKLAAVFGRLRTGKTAN